MAREDQKGIMEKARELLEGERAETQKGKMTVGEAGKKGGQKVKRLVHEGEERERRER